MKKNIFKFSLVLFVSLFLMISCENNSLSGILSDVVNSESKVDYTIRDIQIDSSIVSLESDGIYKNTYNSDGVGFLKKEKLDYDNIPVNSVSKIFLNGNDLYILVSSKLYYVNISSIDNVPIEIDMGENLTVMDIITSQDAVNISNSSYVVCGNYNDTTKNTTLSFFALSPSLDSSISPEITLVMDPGEYYIGLIDTDKGNGYISFINTYKNGKYNYYLIEFGTTINPLKLKEEQNNPLVAFARLNNDLILSIEKNGDFWLYDRNNTADTFRKVSENKLDAEFRLNVPIIERSFTNYSYLMIQSPFDNCLLVFKIDFSEKGDDNNVKITTTNKKINLGYAKGLSNSSRAVHSENIGFNQFVIATENSGYYTIEIDPIKLLINSDDNGKFVKKVQLTSL